MPTPWQRDLADTGAKLTSWLATRLPRASGLEVANLAAPSASGFSNETLLFDLGWREDGEAHAAALVIRIQPTGFQIFPSYDLGLQFKTMQLLAATDVPVPKLRWIEQDDLDLFGAAFYVMEQVPGRVPPDNPPYHQAGWVTEITPEERRAIWLGCFEAMAKIHRIDPRAAGFDFLDQSELGANGLDQEIAHYEKFLAWAARGAPQPTAEAALAWLKANKPKDEPEGLVWGDARIGNIIYQGTTPAAVLDWEMARIGSPEMDVAWAIFLDRHHSEGIQTPRLEGFPSYDETLAHYEKHSGHRVKHFEYYQVFAGFRFAVIMIRIAQQLHRYGIMTAEQSAGFERNNTVTNLLAKLLDLPSPGGAAASFDGGNAGE
jgi:aminoglycoside phosphotransferase (APT) family kinase protein